jgi:hypothetical protein
MRSIRKKCVPLFLVLSRTLMFLGVSAETLSAEPHLQQSFDLRVPVPPAPVAVAGESELVYELHLANFGVSGLVVERLEVTDA